MLPTQTPCPPNDKLALCENPIIDVSDADWCDIVFYCLYSAWNKWVATGQQSPGLQRVCTFSFWPQPTIVIIIVNIILSFVKLWPGRLLTQHM